MHFVIAQTMMKYCTKEDEMYPKSQHICQAADLIRNRVRNRRHYRKVLQNSARIAISLGAQPTALCYLRHAIELLQPSCWDEKAPDVDYEETLEFHLSTAELLAYQRDNEEALRLLTQVFRHGRTAADKSRGWIVKSKISTDAGDFNGAMDALLSSLEELGIHTRQLTTYAQCDSAFKELRDYLQTKDLEALVLQPISQDPRVIALGTVLAEAMAVAFWGDDLTYMYMGVEMMKLHLFTGRFSQVGLACCHLAMAAYSRHKDLDFAASMSDLSLVIFESYADPLSRGAGFILQSFMVEHLRVPLRTILPFIETSVEFAFNSNDPYLMLTSFGLMAATRLHLGQDMSEIETFCTDTPDEIIDWTRDVRSGVLLVSVKQVARALQGKTSWRLPNLVMTDDQHSSVEYMEHIRQRSMRSDRPHDIYWSYGMIPLYVYGHYDKIIELGTGMMDSIERLWCLRASHITYFILPLAILTKYIDNPNAGSLESHMTLVLQCKEVVDFVRKACDVNHAMWSLLIEALMHEHKKSFNSAVQAYEAAIDHCEVHGFPLEEAMALELYGKHQVFHFRFWYVH
jgi:tetratricopeptide (TPR) repeat protein